MRQLVQLQSESSKFKNLNVELIFIFREEGEGVKGLKKIEKKLKPENRKQFRLALDPKKKSSAAYSAKRMTFDNYVIDSKGVIRAIIDGTKTGRATAQELIRELKQIEEE